MQSMFKIFRPVDILFISFILFLSVFGLLTIRDINEISVMLLINIVFIIFIIWFSRLSVKSRAAKIIYDWYGVPSIYLIFKEVHIIIQSTGIRDWDWLFIKVDRFIFGTDPTIWISQWINPVLTEIMQIAYGSYFFIMLALGLELYLKKEIDRYNFALFTIVFGFVLSYFGYMIFPAVGPRFTLHDFYSIDSELKGLWLTIPIRDFLNAGESIPKGALNAYEIAQRDVFPSGHTQMTLITIVLAFRYNVKCRYVITFFGILLIISTVYLRYHYVVDILGGILFALITLPLASVIIKWWERKKIL